MFMRFCTILLLLVCGLSVPFYADASSYFSIDRDGDGYGVGDVGLKGPDADDLDPTVNTPDSVKVKYSDLSHFLAKKNYHPKRTFYLNPKNAETKPLGDKVGEVYTTWERVKKTTAWRSNPFPGRQLPLSN